MEEFPSNSKYAKTRDEVKSIEAAPKRVERVVTGEVMRRKKPLTSRIKETFMGDDSTSIGEYVIVDVIVPAIKDLLYDATMEVVERSLFSGSGRSPGRRTRHRGGSRTNYNGFSRDPRDRGGRDRDRDRDEPRKMSSRARANHEFDEIILPTRVEAKEVLDRMFSFLEKFDEVTVAELYHMVGVTPDYTDERYGWTDLRGSSISHERNGGYLLNLPRPEQLER